MNFGKLKTYTYLLFVVLVLVGAFCLYFLKVRNTKISFSFLEGSKGNTFNETLNASGQMSKQAFVAGYSLTFPWIENVGQVKDKRIKFYAYLDYGAVAVTDDSIYYYFFKSSVWDNSIYVIKEEFVGSQKFNVKGVRRSDTNVNFLKGSSDNWHLHVPSYEEVSLGEIYPGVSINLKLKGGKLEKLVKLSRDREVGSLVIQFQGPVDLRSEEKFFDIMMDGGNARCKVILPREVESKSGVASFEVLSGGKSVRLSFGNEGSKLREISLLFDSGILKGDGYWKCRTFAVSPSGKAYLSWAMSPFCLSLVPPGVYPEMELKEKICGSDLQDIVLVSLNLQESLGEINSVTFIGGSEDDGVIQVEASEWGDVYLGGFTYSKDFLNDTSYMFSSTSSGGSERKFIMVFDPTASELKRWLFLKGFVSLKAFKNKVYVSDGKAIWEFDPDLTNMHKLIDVGKMIWGALNSIAISPEDGSLYILGRAKFKDLAPSKVKFFKGKSLRVIEGYKKKDHGSEDELNRDYGFDAVILKVDPYEGRVERIMVLRGSKDDNALKILIGKRGDVYVCGTTSSLDFPVDIVWRSGKRVPLSSLNIFVSRLSPDLSELKRSVLIAGKYNNKIVDMELDSEGNVYINGHTWSPDFPSSPVSTYKPTSGLPETIDLEHQPEPPSEIFIVKLDKSLKHLKAVTFYGWSSQEYAAGLEIVGGYIYVTGYTTSTDANLREGDSSVMGRGPFGIFVTKFNKDLNLAF